MTAVFFLPYILTQKDYITRFSKSLVFIQSRVVKNCLFDTERIKRFRQQKERNEDTKWVPSEKFHHFNALHKYSTPSLGRDITNTSDNNFVFVLQTNIYNKVYIYFMSATVFSDTREYCLQSDLSKIVLNYFYISCDRC